MKLAATCSVLESEAPLVWTDDVAIPASGPEYDRLVADGRTLLIAPELRRGPQPEHLDAIEEFLHRIP